MINADETYFTGIQSGSVDPVGDDYIVTVNAAGQYAIWPAVQPLPAGWQPRSAALPLAACRKAVITLWPDISPISVRPASAMTGRNDVTFRPASEFALVPSQFAARAAGNPGAVAARGTARLTYGGLLRSANQLAHALREMGVGPETVTGVGLERGADSIRALAGILTAGGGYLPMDPALPARRLGQMCDEARPGSFC